MSGFESCAVCGRPVAPVAPPGAPIKVHAVHEERYTTEDLIVCDACAKAGPETLFGSVKEIEARVKQLAEANRRTSLALEDLTARINRLAEAMKKAVVVI